MKKEEQRIAIAEACGWSNVKIYPRSESNKRHSEDTEPIGIGCRHPSWGGGSCSVPDYLNDLNAMHEAMAYLEPEQVNQFAIELSAIVLENDSKAWWDLNPNEVGHVANATATQRAEAFLRTLNLWTDDT